MVLRRFGPIAIAVVLSAVAQLSTASADNVSTAEQKAILSLHNSYRAEHCVPALTWSAELATAAQRWAENCWIGHDSKRGHIGENIVDVSLPRLSEKLLRQLDHYSKQP